MPTNLSAENPSLPPEAPRARRPFVGLRACVETPARFRLRVGGRVKEKKKKKEEEEDEDEEEAEKEEGFSSARPPNGYHLLRSLFDSLFS